MERDQYDLGDGGEHRDGRELWGRTTRRQRTYWIWHDDSEGFAECRMELQYGDGCRDGSQYEPLRDERVSTEPIPLLGGQRNEIWQL